MRDRLLSLALALLALALFVSIFVPPKPQLSHSMPHSLDKGEQGLAALFQWLKQRDLPVRSWRERWSALAENYPSGHVLISHAPYRMQTEKTGEWTQAPNAYVNDAEQAELQRWIASGNTLVMALGALDAEGNTASTRESNRSSLEYLDFFSNFGWRLSGTASGEYVVPDDSEDGKDGTDSNITPRRDSDADDSEASLDAKNEAAAASAIEQIESQIDAVNARPLALHQLELSVRPGGKPLRFETLAWQAQGALGLKFAPEIDTNDCKRSGKVEAAVAFAKLVKPTDLPLKEPAQLRRDGCVPKGLPAALVLLRSARDQTPAGWWLPFGRGGLVVLGYGSAWKNPNLLRSNSALAAETLLRSFVQPGGSIFFDDYRYGLSKVYDPNALMKDPRLHKTLLIVGIFWLLYAVGRSRRLLPVRIPVPRPSSATFARAISDFYARSLTDKELAAALGAHFLARARRAFGVLGDSDAALWERLAREPSIPAGELQTLQQLTQGPAQGSDNARLTEAMLTLERGFRRV